MKEIEEEIIVEVDLDEKIAQLEWDARIAEAQYQRVVEKSTTEYFNRIFGSVWNR